MKTLVVLLLFVSYGLYAEENETKKADIVLEFKGIKYEFTKKEHDSFIKKISQHIKDLGHKSYTKRVRAVLELTHLGSLHHEAESKINSEYDSSKNEYGNSVDYTDDEEDDEETEVVAGEQYDRKYSYLILKVLTEEFNKATDMEFKLNALEVMETIHNVFWLYDSNQMADYYKKSDEILKDVWRDFKKERLNERLIIPRQTYEEDL